MLFSRLRQFVTASSTKTLDRFWLGLSLTFAAYYAILGMRQAFQSAYVVQDDARAYVDVAAVAFTELAIPEEETRHHLAKTEVLLKPDVVVA